MIGEGKFQTELTRGWDLLETLELGVYRNPRPSKDPETVAKLRAAASYRDEYNVYIATQAYDLLLDDGSLFFFRREPEASTQLSYGYLESPYDVIPYSSFVAEFFGSHPSAALDAWDDYEEHRAQASLRSHVIPLRYDWSPALYREGAHPVGHMHIGFRTEIRLAVDAVLTPAHFVLFVIRQFYLAHWERTACNLDDVVRIAEALYDERIEQRFRKGKDLLELRMAGAAAQLAAAPDERTRVRSPNRS
jgi:hypothetical protein